jgi:hypothetical protein
MALEVIEPGPHPDPAPRFGMFFREDKIGDGLIYSSCPENFYNAGKGKILDTKNVWFFDHNPYVVRNSTAMQTIDMQKFADQTSFFHYGRSSLPCLLSVADRFNTKFGIPTRLRHPRLYKYEDLSQIPNKLVVHTQGDLNEPIALYEDTHALMTDDVMNVIQEKYDKYNIVQVGGKDDKPFGRKAKDRRGISIWDSVKEIADAAIFIGVNSGPMNIALCYPRINIRMFEPQFPQTVLENFFIPMDAKFAHNQWFDYGIKIFNRYDADLGATYSYLKI